MTESELALFKEGPKSLISAGSAVPTRPGVNGEASGSSDTYNEGEHELPKGVFRSTEYATVNEIALSEERKEQKKMRKTSKPLQKALNRGQQVDDSAAQQVSENGFGSTDMGFRPSFRSNPLQHIEVRIPPTPPPTPATGAGSSAQSASDEFDREYGMATN